MWFVSAGAPGFACRFCSAIAQLKSHGRLSCGASDEIFKLYIFVFGLGRAYDDVNKISNDLQNMEIITIIYDITVTELGL